MSQLDQKYAGTSDFVYNHDVYWSNEVELDKQRIQRHGLVIPDSSGESKSLTTPVAEGDWPEDVQEAINNESA